MTLDADRRVGLPRACPFVAFADERDLRSGEPDHRHRCYAEPRPEPRALAHQERYCLSPGFAACPTFLDWASREAAQVVEQPAAFAAAAGGPGLFDEAVEVEDGATAAEREGAIGSAEDEAALAGAEAPPFMADAPRGVEQGPWARPRRRESYPRLRGPSVNASPLIVGIVALALAAAALFFLPTLLAGMFGGRGTPAPSSPSPGASPTAGPATPTPLATPLLYTVKSGDTLTKIAAKYGVSVNDLLAANPTIANPDQIKIGDKVLIPTPTPAATLAPASPGGSPSP